MEIHTEFFEVLGLFRNPRQFYAASERQYTAACREFMKLGVVFTVDGRRNKEIYMQISKSKAVLVNFIA